ncbi:MAG: hypothetical protein AAB110_08395 [Candidatus Desantisbacteria bacterium]
MQKQARAAQMIATTVFQARALQQLKIMTALAMMTAHDAMQALVQTETPAIQQNVQQTITAMQQEAIAQHQISISMFA